MDPITLSIIMSVVGFGLQARKDGKARKADAAAAAKSLEEAEKQAEAQLKQAKTEEMRRIAQEYVDNIRRKQRTEKIMTVVETGAIAAGILSLVYLGYVGIKKATK